MNTINLQVLPLTAQQKLLNFYQFLISKNKVTKKSTTKKLILKHCFLMCQKWTN